MSRSRWLEAPREHHLDDLRRLRVEFWREAQAQLTEFIAAKVVDLSSGSARDARRLEAALTAVLDELDAFAGRNSDRFAAARLDYTALRNCLKATLNDSLQSRAAEALRPSAVLVAQYPLPVQAFLRPDLVAASLMVSTSRR